MTTTSVRTALSNMPLGFCKVTEDSLIAAKAELAAKFISRETGENREDIASRLCTLAGVTPTKLDPERLLGLRAGVTEDYAFCQYMLEKFPDRFDAVRKFAC